MKTNYCAFTKRKRASLATIIGHRGIPTLAPENTLESFKLAFDQGADIVEMDVRLSRDNQVVVIHDRDLKRTTGVENRVSELTLKQLQELNAAHNHPKWHQGNCKIPSLREVFELFPDKLLAIEIKENSSLLVKKVMSLIAEFGRNQLTLVQIFRLGKKEARLARQLAHSCSPPIHTGHSKQEQWQWGILANLPRPSWKFACESKVLDFPQKRLGLPVITRALVENAHANGVSVFAWTVNKPKDIARLYKLGVDAIYTDDVGQTLSVLRDLRDKRV
ncbi:MAG: putative glycerophosphoryl diester phosphodiesterase 1 [bacterium ADurb.Bin425]|jgi:glycerophosphoryl diester phosphodiesterase|nr:MAG: putative glycerophosphoryl diester phosphodiesterase 1 [bacterium ADurb.Bin425]